MKNRIDKWLLLTWKKLLVIIGAWFLAFVLHNLVYALFFNYFQSTGGDEPFFFIIGALVLPIYFLSCFVYTIIKMIQDKTLFKAEFVIKLLIAVILGAVATLLLIKFTFVNPEMIFMLTVIFIAFTSIFYILIKLIGRKKKIVARF